MIKPATPLPWVTDQHVGNFVAETARHTIRSAKEHPLASDNLQAFKNAEQDAEYIKTACNLFPELVKVAEAYIHNMNEYYPEGGIADEAIAQVEDLLRRCGARVGGKL